MGFGRGYVLRKWRVLTPAQARRACSRARAVLLGGQALIDRNLSGAPRAARGLARGAARASAIRAAVAERGGGDSLLRTLRRRRSPAPARRISAAPRRLSAPGRAARRASLAPIPR